MDKLNITLKLYGGLDKYINNYVNKEGISLKLNSSQTIKDILKKIEIPKNRITLIMADDKTINLDYVVKDNDIIKIFSQIGGG